VRTLTAAEAGILHRLADGGEREPEDEPALGFLHSLIPDGIILAAS